MKKDIAIINPSSNVSVCTLWTKKETILSKLPEKVKNKICVIGTLYTTRGIDYVLETLGSFPQIDTLIIYGADLSESGNAIVNTFVKKDLGNLKVDEEKARTIIDTVEIIDLREEARNNNLDALIEAIEKSYKKNAVPKRSKVNLNVEEHIGVSSWPYAIVNQRIYETSVFRAWIKLLHLIYNFGSLKFSEYEESQKEIINLVVTIDLRGKSYEIEKKFFEVGFTERDFEKHTEEVLTSKKPEGVEYTYGERLRDHKYGKDQIEFIIEKLAKTPFSRRCVGVTWDHEIDMKTSMPPCIVAVQGIITENYYHHTCFIRSNDMVRGWPVNMVGQIKLAEYITNEINKRAETDYKVGTVTTISVSAHIYEHDFNYVKNILNKYASKVFLEFVPDPIGNVLVYQENDGIIIEHRTPDHKEVISRKKFNNFKDAYESLKETCAFMLPSHALYVGKEVKTAFEKLEKGEKYIQDEA